MKESLIEKIKRHISYFIRKLTGHKYCCCNKLFKNCEHCEVNSNEYIMPEKQRRRKQRGRTAPNRGED